MDRPRPRAWESGKSDGPVRRHLRASTPLLIASAPGWSSRSRLMPCEPLDALKNLTKEVPRQVAFGKLPGEVPGMPDEASARPEQPLLEAREGPALDGDRQDQSGRRR